MCRIAFLGPNNQSEAHAIPGERLLVFEALARLDRRLLIRLLPVTCCASTTIYLTLPELPDHSGHLEQLLTGP